jgi:DNA-binding GntR family transcriptional regulator
MRHDRLHEWGEHNLAFHEALLEPAGDPQGLLFIRTLHRLSERYQRMYIALIGSAPRSHAEHAAILKAAADGATDKACRLLERHILGAGASLLAVLRQQQRALQRDRPRRS